MVRDIARAAGAVAAPEGGRTGNREGWRRSLIAARKRLRVSRGALAQLAGVSPSTIRGYEVGRRHPGQKSLDAILDALRLERTEANAIRQATGYAPVESRWDGAAGYYCSVEEAQKAVESVPWPQFVVNEANEMVAANRAMFAVTGVDFSEERKRRSPPEMNILALANTNDFHRRIENWDEVLTTRAALFKGSAQGPDELAAPSLYLTQVVSHFSEHNHGFLTRLIAAWDRATPQPARVRWMYPIVWCDPEFGRMRFQGIVNTINEREGLSIDDWIPLDARSWTALEEVKRARLYG